MTKQPILVVDDDEDVRTMLSIILKDEGYTTATAADGVEALERMRATTPALVFVDLMMPRMDGTVLIQTMAADKRLARIPIAIMSGQTTTPPDALAHVNACLTKPVELDDVLTVASQYAGDAPPPRHSHAS